MHRAAGFSLIELLIAIMVIGVGLLGILLGNTFTQKTGEIAHEQIVAIQDAHRVIELMRNASANGNFPGNVTAAFPNAAVIAGFNNLSSEQVTVIYADPTSDPLDVTVTTSWLELGVRNTSTRLRTLMTKRG